MLVGAQDVAVVRVGRASAEKTFVVVRENGANTFLSDELHCTSENMACLEAFTATYRQRATSASTPDAPMAMRLRLTYLVLIPIVD